MQVYSAMAMPKLKLNSGYELPVVGFGTSLIDKGEVGRVIRKAIEVGYRHFDCAWLYKNEKEIGDALQEVYKEGKVKREDLFITSKLWGVFHHPDKVRTAIQESLNALQTDYLDLYLIHTPSGLVDNGEIFPNEGTDVDYVDTWKAMSQLQNEGLAKSIGISNFNQYQINRILRETNFIPAVLQIESHPYLTCADLVKLCKKNGIAVTAYAPFGSPMRPWKTAEEPVVMEDSVIKEIARWQQRSVAQVLVRFHIQRGLSVISKTITPARLEENFKVFDFELSADDMTALLGLDRNWRAFHFEWFAVGHKYKPFTPDYTEE